MTVCLIVLLISVATERPESDEWRDRWPCEELVCVECTLWRSFANADVVERLSEVTDLVSLRDNLNNLLYEVRDLSVCEGDEGLAWPGMAGQLYCAK